MSIEMPNVDLKKSKQPNRIDIKKYKEMIENMRSNYWHLINWLYDEIII